MARLFTGDYSTGDYRQWDTIQNVLYNGAQQGYPGGYPCRIVNLGDCGHACRYEVRDGDVPEFGGGERSQIVHATEFNTAAGDTVWYAFSTMFDPTFPSDHHDQGWGLTSQWKEDTVGGSPTIKCEIAPWYGSNGTWSVVQDPQSAPGVHLGAISLLNMPLDRGNWHDLKLEIKWSTSDVDGFVRVWRNGELQTLTTGGTTFTGRTLTPGDSGSVHYSEGYYRDDALTFTGIVYHSNFRMADTEDGI